MTIAWHQAGFKRVEMGREVNRTWAYIRVIRKRIQRQLRQKFWVFYVLEIVLSEGAICVSALKQDMRPVGGAGVFEKQESLVACELISISSTGTGSGLPSSKQSGNRPHKDYRAR